MLKWTEMRHLNNTKLNTSDAEHIKHFSQVGPKPKCDFTANVLGKLDVDEIAALPLGQKYSSA